ncbi:MAG TPA: glycoside hydrolase family 27 protein, partial [Niabella sp.]|nr:glycoside hydrolase family 27 protein [Niabella sp.]
GREITFGICEWGDRSPWLWAHKAGGQLWRTTADVRDKWKSLKAPSKPEDLHGSGAGILDILNINGGLHSYAGPGGWNDPDMLVVGLYGKKGPSGDLGGVGCTDTEYQSQMSLWCLMAAPLMISCDVRNMNEHTKKVLLNKDIIAIDQDPLGKQAERKINNETWQVFVKPLSNGDIALGVLNASDKTQSVELDLGALDIVGKSRSFDVWEKTKSSVKNKLKLTVASHETKVFRLSK